MVNFKYSVLPEYFTFLMGLIRVNKRFGAEIHTIKTGIKNR